MGESDGAALNAASRSLAAQLVGQGDAARNIVANAAESSRAYARSVVVPERPETRQERQLEALRAHLLARSEDCLLLVAALRGDS